MASLNLDGPGFEDLVNSLLDAYDFQSLEQMLLFRLDKKLNQFANTSKPILMVVFELVKKAEAEGWTSNLVEEAHKYVPGNRKLADFYNALGGNEQGNENNVAQPDAGVPFLAQDQILELHDLLVKRGLAEQLDMLVGGMNLQFRSQLPTGANPAGRLLQILFKLNDQGPLIDGEVPLVTMLTNAVHQTQAFAESKRIQELLDEVNR